MRIVDYREQQLDQVIDLSLRAWAPVFPSIEGSLDPEVYAEFYPDGWRVSQRQSVTAVCADPAVRVSVAVEDERVAGFVALKTDAKSRMGEIYMIAVDPDFQRRGIAAALTEHAIAWFREAGMTTVMVETGGDPGHAPARATYEAAGFRICPVARYFRKL